MSSRGKQIMMQSNKSKYYSFEPLSKSKKTKVASLGVSEDDEIRNKLKEFDREINFNLKVFRKNIMFPCRLSISYIKNVIRNIIPMEIFGCNHNFKKFVNTIKILCTASIHENISFYKMLQGWQLDKIIWTKKAKNEKTLIIQIILTLTNKIKNEIIRKLYNVQHSKTAYKVEFYPVNAYRSLKDKAVNEMVSKKQLIPYKGTPKFYSKLMLKPKNHMKSYRPIVLTKLLSTIRKRYVLSSLRNQGAVFNRNLYTAWTNFVNATGDRPVYGVKIDLQDAFSNVDIAKVIELLKKFLKEAHTRCAILNSLNNQVVQVGKNRFYIWNRGLMQGMTLSAKLCDLYRSFFDLVHLKSFIKRNIFFHRTVDDYFFCSVNKEEVVRFQRILETKCLISKNKTKTNVNSTDNEILYNGRIFDLSSKEVKIHIDADLETYRYKSKKYYQLQDYSGSFKAMVTVALKVECAINERFTTVPAKLEDFIMGVVKYYVKYVRKLLIKSKAQEDTMGIPRKVLKFIGIKAFILIFQKRYLPYKNVIEALKKSIKGYKHPLLGKSFNKLPDSFSKIRMKRVLPQYK